jgi:hypothetical protein
MLGGVPLWTNVWWEEVTSQDGACAWLGLSLQDWTNIATILGAIGTFIVAFVALLVSVAALWTQREALPVTARFGLVKRGYVDRSGVRWVQAWMQNTGVRAYAHEVYRHDWQPFDPLAERKPDVARLGVPDSLPEHLRTLSKRQLRGEEGVFKSQYLPPGQYVMFWVSCPLGIDKVKLAATVSARRWSRVRYVSSRWLEMPSAKELIVSSLETQAYFEQQARGPEGPADPAERVDD